MKPIAGTSECGYNLWVTPQQASVYERAARKIQDIVNQKYANDWQHQEITGAMLVAWAKPEDAINCEPHVWERINEVLEDWFGFASTEYYRRQGLLMDAILYRLGMCENKDVRGIDITKVMESPAQLAEKKKKDAETKQMFKPAGKGKPKKLSEQYAEMRQKQGNTKI